MIPADSRLEACIQCGTCGGSCPSYADMDHTPRQIFALVRAGARDKVLDSNTPWMCVSCYLCAVRCPQQIHIPDVMYALKAKATQEIMNMVQRLTAQPDPAAVAAAAAPAMEPTSH